MNKLPTAPRFTLVLLLLAPVFFHFYYLFSHAVNAPRLDDFLDALTFLPAFNEADSWQEKIRLIFSSYKGHRYGLTHTVYALTQPIDFRAITLWGNGLVIAYLALFAISLRDRPDRLALLAITSLVLFNLQGWMGTYWQLGLLPTTGSLPIAFAAFVAASSGHRLAAVLFAVLATYTHGNGIFAWPALLLYALWQAHQPGHRMNGNSLFWLTATTVMFVFYFKVQAQWDDEQTAIPLMETAQHILTSPWLYLKGVLSMAGGFMIFFQPDEPWRIQLSILVGTVELAILGWCLRAGIWRHAPALWMLLIYDLLTIAAISGFRTLEMGYTQALQGHYKYYPATLCLLTLLALLDYCRTRLATHYHLVRSGCIVLLAGLFAWSILLYGKKIVTYHRELADDTRNWLHTNELTHIDTRLFADKPNKRLANAVRQHAYDPWTLVPGANTARNTHYLSACASSHPTLDATLSSHRKALAVHLTLETGSAFHSMLLCSPKQAIHITLSPDQFVPNKKGTHTLELWVPRQRGIPEDDGPWQAYRLP